MITLVCFPSAVEVVKSSESRSTWKPGEGEIVAITRGAWGEIVFETNKAGVLVTVWPLPGTVVLEEREPYCCGCGATNKQHERSRACSSMPSLAETSAIAEAAILATARDSKDPPPARPVDKPPRKGR